MDAQRAIDLIEGELRRVMDLTDLRDLLVFVRDAGATQADLQRKVKELEGLIATNTALEGKARQSRMTAEKEAQETLRMLTVQIQEQRSEAARVIQETTQRVQAETHTLHATNDGLKREIGQTRVILEELLHRIVEGQAVLQNLRDRAKESMEAI